MWTLRRRGPDCTPITPKAGSLFHADQHGEELQAITDECGGSLDIDVTIQRAKSPSNPLHKHYEWDVEKAAYANWVDTTRRLVRIIRVEDRTTESGSARAFVSVKDANGTNYRALGDVKKSVSLQELLLKQAKSDLEAFRRRYAEFQDVCADVDAALGKISARMSKEGKKGARAAA